LTNSSQSVIRRVNNDNNLNNLNRDKFSKNAADEYLYWFSDCDFRMIPVLPASNPRYSSRCYLQLLVRIQIYLHPTFNKKSFINFSMIAPLRHTLLH
jgi:hypothetical protein